MKDEANTETFNFLFYKTYYSSTKCQTVFLVLHFVILILNRTSFHMFVLRTGETVQ